MPLALRLEEYRAKAGSRRWAGRCLAGQSTLFQTVDSAQVIWQMFTVEYIRVESPALKVFQPDEKAQDSDALSTKTPKNRTRHEPSEPIG
jgi:hypothetical protein